MRKQWLWIGGLTLSALLLPWSNASGSDVIHYAYEPGQTAAQLRPRVEAILNGFVSESAIDRHRAVDELRDLAFSTRRKWLDEKTRRQRRDLQKGDPRRALPPEYVEWSGMARSLMHEVLAPSMDALLDDPGIVWKILLPAGILGADSPALCSFAMTHLDDPDSGHRRTACGYLSALGPAGVTLALRQLPTSDARRRASIFQVFALAEGIGDLDTKLAAALEDTLLAGLDDHRQPIRELSAQALGQPGFDPSRIVPVLIRGLVDDNIIFSRYCSGSLLDALQSVSPYRTDLLAALDHRDESTSINALYLLLRGPEPDSVLVDATRNRHPRTRETALNLLVERGCPDELLIPLLDHALRFMPTRETACGICARGGARMAALAPTLEAVAADVDYPAQSMAPLSALAAVSPNLEHVADVYRRHWSTLDVLLVDKIRLLGPAGEEFLPELEQILAGPLSAAQHDALSAVRAIGPGARSLAPLLPRFLAAEFGRTDSEMAFEALLSLRTYPCNARALIESKLGESWLNEELKDEVVVLLEGSPCS